MSGDPTFNDIILPEIPAPPTTIRIGKICYQLSGTTADNNTHNWDDLDSDDLGRRLTFGNCTECRSWVEGYNGCNCSAENWLQLSRGQITQCELLGYKLNKVYRILNFNNYMFRLPANSQPPAISLAHIYAPWDGSFAANLCHCHYLACNDGKWPYQMSDSKGDWHYYILTLGGYLFNLGASIMRLPPNDYDNNFYRDNDVCTPYGTRLQKEGINWVIYIFPSSGTMPIWKGIKTGGYTPVGVYSRVQGTDLTEELVIG